MIKKETLLSFEKRYKTLNKKQKEAVDTLEGPLLVVAGPGTGKTELLSLRTANILIKTDVGPGSILCLTFTEAGARAMRERLVSIMGETAYKVPIFTYHGFCSYIMGAYPEYFYEGASFSLIDDITKNTLYEKIFQKLPHKNPLSKKGPDGLFVYLADTIKRIDDIKKYGLTASEYKKLALHILKENEEVEKIIAAKWPEGRLSFKNLGFIESLLSDLKKQGGLTALFYHKELEAAYTKACEEEKTEKIGSWRDSYLSTEDDKKILSDTEKKDKILALTEIYELYEKELELNLSYEYQDLITEVRLALEKNESLRSELAERYIYIQVDEFQDSSEAQLKLTKALTREQSRFYPPNICAVGDDDQGIYKFQGAEINNIINFRSSDYENVKTVVLDQNYRSQQNILDVSREVIKKAEIRLETRYEDIIKDLKASGTYHQEGRVTILPRFKNREEECSFVSEEVRKISQAEPHATVAVLSRTHGPLIEISKHLQNSGVDFSYTKKTNIFEFPHIREIFTVITYLSSVTKDQETRNELLPEILSFPFWGVPRNVIFSIAHDAKKGKSSWLETIQNRSETKKIYDFLEECFVVAGRESPERFLSFFIEESNFKNYYFSEESLKKNPRTYITFLSALRTFIAAIVDYKKDDIVSIYDMADMYERYTTFSMPLTISEDYGSSDDKINLMTAHGSKGLEFDYVFLLSTNDEIWNKKKNGNKSPLPAPLKALIAGESDTEDDFIRLLFVAMTRAKHSLIISYHTTLNRYLEGTSLRDKDQEEEKRKKEKKEYEYSHLELFIPPFKEEEKNIFKKLTENYLMSVTHFNNFIDVTKGGPLYFLEQNLLQFPQPQNSAGAFGNAVHKAIETIILEKKWKGEVSEEKIFAVFRQTLLLERLPKEEFRKQEERGITILQNYLKKKGASLSGEDLIEVDMRHEGVIVGGAKLTGKIDYIKKEKNGIKILDFKTGETIASWDKNKHPKDIKAHRYKYQLMMYKLLLEESETWKNVPLLSLGLEFVEDDEIHTLFLECEEEEYKRFKKLVSLVYRRIEKGDFSIDLKEDGGDSLEAILAFEEKILSDTL
jgi:DNA helicase-2/ATP-dependent DNA helicase PcrA